MWCGFAVGEGEDSLICEALGNCTERSGILW